MSIFPNLSLDSMIKWDGQDYSAIVVTSSPIVFQRIGAVNGDLYEWNGEDVRVENSFKGFRDAASLLIALMKRLVKETNTIMTDYLLCKSMQQYLAKQTTFSPRFPINQKRSSTGLSRFQLVSGSKTHKVILRQCHCCWSP